MNSVIAGLREAYHRLAKSYKTSYQESGCWGKALLILVPILLALCLLTSPLTFFAPEPTPTPDGQLVSVATGPAEVTADLSPTEPATSPPTLQLDPTRAPSPTPSPRATSTSAPTATSTPTATPTATATASPMPEPTVTKTPQPPAPSSTAPATPSVALPEGLLATVQQVVDGDTIEVLIEGQAVRVQYIGVDTPEWDEPLFDESSGANERLVAGQTVLLVKDVSEVDPYDRLLRYVYLQDGTFVNAELVRLGYARAAAYPPDVAHQALFSALEEEARSAGLGIWGQPVQAAEPTVTSTPVGPAPPPPASGAAVTISAVDKSAEYVDLLNTGSQAVDLTGWILRSEKGFQDCRLEVVIQPGETLRVWALASDAGQGGYNCGFASNIWNNSEPDPAVLIDTQGVEVARYS
ncbi:MAG: thermonuclease family protein [Candidatus Promineifilaceae bacterium]